MDTFNNTIIPDGYKLCPSASRCASAFGPIQPATREYFPVFRNGMIRPDRPCRACIAKAKLDYDRAYFAAHAELRAARTRQWAKDNPDATRIRVANQRAASRGLPASLTISDWRQCLAYWDGCCAGCGQPTGLWHTIALDHWIPINDSRSDNPGSVLSNIIPLCHSKGGTWRCCNNTKHDQDPLVWLENEFGTWKAVRVAKAIKAYQQWAMEQVG